MKRRKLLLVLDKISGYLAALSKICGEVLIGGLTLLITVDVLVRTIFGRSILIQLELSGYLLIGIVFLGLAYTQRAGRHIIIDTVTNLFSKRVQGYLWLACLITSTAFTGWFCVATAEPAASNLVQHVVSISGLSMPMWIPYALIPVGLGLYSLVLLIELVVDIIHRSLGEADIERKVTTAW